IDPSLTGFVGSCWQALHSLSEAQQLRCCWSAESSERSSTNGQEIRKAQEPAATLCRKEFLNPTGHCKDLLQRCEYARSYALAGALLQWCHTLLAAAPSTLERIPLRVG